MYDEAQKIVAHLPIRRNDPENDYIEHLLGALRVLDESEDRIRGFAMLPLHLLFLLAIQCKLLRVAQERRELYTLSITLKNPRKEQEGILRPVSPFTLGFFSESELADLCKAIGLPQDGVGHIKDLVRYRNDNLAHAKGYVEMNPDDRVADYLTALGTLQAHMLPLNDAVANEWSTGLTSDDDLQEFVETRLLGSYLCPADFTDGLLKKKFDVFQA